MDALVGGRAVVRVRLVLGSDAYGDVVRAQRIFFCQGFEWCRVQGSCVKQSVLLGEVGLVRKGMTPLVIFLSCRYYQYPVQKRATDNSINSVKRQSFGVGALYRFKNFTRQGKEGINRSSAANDLGVER